MNKFKVGDKVLYKGDMHEHTIAIITNINNDYEGRVQLIFDDEQIVVCDFNKVELVKEEI